MSQVANLPQPPATAPNPSFPFSTPLWWFMMISCIGVVGYATRFFIFDAPNDHFARYILPLRLHIAGGIGALLSGPWQFSEKLRARALNFHRWLGRFYLLSVALGSMAGFAMAVVSMEGLPTHLGFGILAVVWFGTGLQAYRLICRGDIEAHLQWMTRNFALSLAAVTLREGENAPQKLHLIPANPGRPGGTP